MSERAYLNILHRLTLETESEKDRTLDCAQMYVGAQALFKVELPDGGEQVHDDVVVELVVRVRLEPFQVEGRHEHRQLRCSEFCISRRQNGGAIRACAGGAERKGREG